MRLLTKAEAAKYCMLSVSAFIRLCPVRPLSLGSDDPRLLRYDVRDLDQWIDDMKSRARLGASQEQLDADDYLKRLDQ
jgi:hypothetical protein